MTFVGASPGSLHTAVFRGFGSVPLLFDPLVLLFLCFHVFLFEACEKIRVRLLLVAFGIIPSLISVIQVVALSRIAGWKYASMSVHTREPDF